MIREKGTCIASALFCYKPVISIDCQSASSVSSTKFVQLEKLTYGKSRMITVLITIPIIVVVMLALSYFDSVISKTLKEKSELTETTYNLQEKLILVRQIRKVVIIIVSIFVVGFLVYETIRSTPMQAFVMEWLNLLIRWGHVIAGIMWIGASFYFIFLENNLNRTEDVRDELAGNLWAIHGGGFYFLEKYKVAPKVLPKDLHWFKYEAYFTWMTGVALLIVVYYMDAKSFLIDPQVADISTTTAIAIGVGTMIIGWLIYDGLCKSPLIKKPVLFVLIGFLILIASSYFLTHVFSSRAAYIHVGALIGTIMAWNVYFVIIPSQKALVKAAILGKPLDATLGQKAGQRSLHNNYFTLPVIFIMISNHFPSTYGHEWNWIILMVITLASAGIKHFWNLHERGVKSKYILPVSIVAMISLALITSPAFETSDEPMEAVSFSEANEIIQRRCVQCHSVTPTDDMWKVAPLNVFFDTPDQIITQAERIMIRTVSTKTMPLGNKTQMTDEERNKLKAWILQGAKLD